MMARKTRVNFKTVPVNGLVLERLIYANKTNAAKLAEDAGVSEGFVNNMLKSRRCDRELVAKVAAILGPAGGELVGEGLPTLPTALPKNNSNDWFVQLLADINNFCNDFMGDTMIRKGMLCETKGDVELAVRMILAGSGYYLSDDKNILEEEAIQLVEIVTSISKEAYLAKVEEAWRAIPWSLAFAISDSRRVGCIRLLPLSEKTYRAVGSGQISIDECGPSNFQFPSNFLFWDALGEAHIRDYPFIEKRTRHCVRTLLVQAAQLSRGVDKPLRILSLAGTPEYEKRVEKLEFHRVGARMPGTDLEIYEMDMLKASLIPIIIRELQRRILIDSV